MFTGPPAFPGRATPGPAHGFFTNHESRNTAFFRPGLRSMKIMVREMSLIRGLGAPAKEMSFPHHLALFKDLSCPLLPTIARHCPLLPAKKMSQSLVASQYGRRSRGPGRVPRAAPRQPGCTVEQTNHESRPFFACFDRRVVRHAGWCPRAARSLLRWAFSRGMARLSRGMRGILLPSRCPRAVRRSRSASRRAPFAGNPGKVHKIPLPPGKCVKRSARCGSRRNPGLYRCGERNMNPFRERRTFYMALTLSLPPFAPARGNR